MTFTSKDKNVGDTIPAMIATTNELFNESINGKEKQRHSFDFQILLESLGDTIKTPEMKILKYSLNGDLSDFEIRNLLGGETKLVHHKNKETALITLSTTMTDEGRDHGANIVYYLNEHDIIYYAYCTWCPHDKEWFCDCGKIGQSWEHADRILYPAIETQNKEA